MIIGLDVGGTHTDVVLLDEQRLLKEVKVPTDTADLFNSVLDGLTAVTEDIDPASVERIVLSTTLTTNAIVQGKTPPVGMIVSSGPGIDPEFYRTNAHYYSVAGSIDHRGREVEPLDADEIKQIAADLKNDGIRYVGVVGKFSVRNPSHELDMGRILGESFEKIFMGHRISGNLNFGRRIATAFLNASVYPLHKEFFQAVEKSSDDYPEIQRNKKDIIGIPKLFLGNSETCLRQTGKIDDPIRIFLFDLSDQILERDDFPDRNSMDPNGSFLGRFSV